MNCASRAEEARARVKALLRPPRVRAVARRPAGWFAVSRSGLRDILAWALLEDGKVVGLVADRRGLRPAVGRGYHGYLPAAPHSAGDVQLSPPAVTFPVVDLEEAIDGAADPWTPAAQAAIYQNLRDAASAEWAWRALAEYAADPGRFLRRHFALIAEHGRPADLDADWRAGLDSITKPPATAGIKEDL